MLLPLSSGAVECLKLANIFILQPVRWLQDRLATWSVALSTWQVWWARPSGCMSEPSVVAQIQLQVASSSFKARLS